MGNDNWYHIVIELLSKRIIALMNEVERLNRMREEDADALRHESEDHSKDMQDARLEIKTLKSSLANANSNLDTALREIKIHEQEYQKLLNKMGGA